MTTPDPLFDVAGKRIVVAGACGGIGREICRALAERGARLMLADCDEKGLSALACELGALHQPLDVTDEDATRDLMRAAAQALGPIDGLVNATGVFAVGPAEKLTLPQFNRSLEVNVTGALILSRSAAAQMSTGGGAIVHLASVSSQVANMNYAAYASSKAALSQLVRVLAREWAPRGIRVNALGPAMIETPLTAPQLSNASFRDQALAVIPMGRFGKPADLLGPALLLLSPGGQFITGQTIFVDGGRTLV